MVSEGVDLWKLIILTIKTTSANSNYAYGYNLLNTKPSVYAPPNAMVTHL